MPCACGAARVDKEAALELECLEAVGVSGEKDVDVHGAGNGGERLGVTSRDDLVVEVVGVAHVSRADDLLDLAGHQQLLELGRQVVCAEGDMQVANHEDQHGAGGGEQRQGARGEEGKGSESATERLLDVDQCWLLFS
ncbi:hypothetical protein L1887_53355 [Cichorium endivia]|nr:hypothetical protein L1887_53355 [Cichorium endivia]